jgi:class 3 adenylate cyclase
MHEYAKSSVKTYEAATGGAVHALAAFEPEYMDIQGDGVYALFGGDMRYERALCAAVTVRTWSEKTLVPALEKKFGERTPATGFKIGIASSRILGKRVGVRGTHEPVWAGKAVNYSAKLAQETDRHEILVTERVFDHFKDNDYVRLSCGCDSISGTPTPLWTTSYSSKLPAGEDTVHLLKSPWCDTHGNDFCDAIQNGQTDRELPAWVA